MLPMDKTEWFRNAEYGFFFHFLNTGGTSLAPEASSPRNSASPAAWNRTVDSFDVERLAAQMHELKAGYVFLTVGQNSGYYCSPNAAYDRITGNSGEASTCSKRDLVADFADALAEYGIPLLAYTTTLAPAFDFNAVEKFKSIPPWNCNANCHNYNEVKRFAGTDPRLREFQEMWSAVHAEWAARWGRKVRGWWVDGCYFAPRMYAFPDPPNGRSFAAALRAGNPDALVAFNPGVVYPPRAVDSCQDYLAGEINEPEYGILNGPLIGGMQYHVLSYAGKTWGKLPLRGDARFYAAATRNIVDNGGVMTWDLPFTPDGIADKVFAVLKEFVRDYAAGKEAFPKTTVQVTSPYWDGDGTGIPGKVELASERPAELTLEWNGVKTVLEPSSGPVELPLPPPRSTECRLNLSCGGFSRGIAVPVGRNLILTEQPSNPLELETRDRSRMLARYRCSVKDDVFYVDAEIFESEPDLRAQPWACSCLELFLSPDGVFRTQFCIRHDCAMFQVDNSAVEPCSGIRVSKEVAAEGILRLLCAVPLSLAGGCGAGEFRFEIQQSINCGGQVLRNCLFGTRAQPEFARVRIASPAGRALR